MSGTSTQILLADYNDANRIISRKSLERSGYSVTTAKNGAEALGIAGLTGFDLILLDIMMPIMDGMKALRRLRRQNGPNQNTPAFALTAYLKPDDRQRYRIAGFDAVLSKPIRSGDLEMITSGFKKMGLLQPVASLEIPSPPYEGLLDQAHIVSLIEQSDDAALKLAQSQFWISITDHCKIIQQSLPNALRSDTESLSQFRRAVHSIKGSSETFGLIRVADISRRLQNATPLKIPSLMSALSDALLESRPALSDALIRARKFNVPVKVSR